MKLTRSQLRLAGAEDFLDEDLRLKESSQKIHVLKQSERPPRPADQEPDPEPEIRVEDDCTPIPVGQARALGYSLGSTAGNDFPRLGFKVVATPSPWSTQPNSVQAQGYPVNSAGGTRTVGVLVDVADPRAEADKLIADGLRFVTLEGDPATIVYFRDEANAPHVMMAVGLVGRALGKWSPPLSLREWAMLEVYMGTPPAEAKAKCKRIAERLRIKIANLVDPSAAAIQPETEHQGDIAESFEAVKRAASGVSKEALDAIIEGGEEEIRKALGGTSG